MTKNDWIHETQESRNVGSFKEAARRTISNGLRQRLAKRWVTPPWTPRGNCTKIFFWIVNIVSPDQTNDHSLLVTARPILVNVLFPLWSIDLTTKLGFWKIIIFIDIEERKKEETKKRRMIDWLIDIISLCLSFFLLRCQGRRYMIENLRYE